MPNNLTNAMEFINLTSSAAKEIDELNVDLILRLDNLVSVSYFDIDMYKKFNELYTADIKRP